MQQTTCDGVTITTYLFSMAEKEVRKTTAKKTVRRTTTKVVSPKTTVRKTVTTTARKAPARMVPQATTSHRSPKMLLAGFGFFIVLLGVSAAIGLSDKGQLNVEGLISTRKQNATPEEKVALEAVPTEQVKNSVPNGGLVGMGQQPEPLAPTPVVVATTTATTSTQSASSTAEAAIATSTPL
jgi:hypothetical protein